MSARIDVLLWAQRVVAMKQASPHQLLDIPKDATVDDAQAGFHKIAKMAHPDLHRNALTPEELELVTKAYAAIAGAYQAFRGQQMATTRMRPSKPDGSVAATPSGTAPVGNTAHQMSSRALVYYRKAELALKRGDLAGAMLQLKMAIGTDPTSAFLRTALLEVESEVRKTS
jgi:preprotein translocase subunit Sec63